MAEKTISRDPAIARFVEKQMRNWEISRSQRYGEASQTEVADFITIANIVGAGGREIAQMLGEELGWPVFDRELLTNMAEDDELRASLYHSMDERDLGWLEMTLRPLLDQKLTKNDYFHKLIQAVLCLARKGPAVFVGRSADLILPHDRGLRVKLIASKDHCTRKFAEKAGIGEDQARAEVDRIEAERQEFILHHFHAEANDPKRFDLLVNVERFTSQQVVRLILLAHAERLALISEP